MSSIPHSEEERGRGRPESEEPSAKTRANRASDARAAAREIGEERGLPERLRIDRLVETDAARVLQYMPDDLRRFDSRGGDLHYCDERGVWQRAALGWNANGASGWRRFVHVAIRAGRTGAIAELGKNAPETLSEDEKRDYIAAFASVRTAGERHEKDVAATIINHSAAVKRVDVRAEHDYRDRPLIPLGGEDGGAWDVAAGKAITRAELRDCHFIGVQWAMPAPRMDAYENPRAGVQEMVKLVLDERYEYEFLQRVALGLLGADKRMEVVKAETPDFGKSTYWGGDAPRLRG